MDDGKGREEYSANMKKIDRSDMIYSLALAGISAALAIIYVTLAFFIAAGLSIMIPLSKRYWFSSVAALVVSGVASFFIAGSDVTVIAGYIVYFGPMAIISGTMYNLHVKWYIQLPIKLLYINGALALLYYVLGTIVVDASIMEILPYYAIAIIGSVLLLAVDVILVFIYSKLGVIVSKVLRGRKKNSPEKSAPASDDEDPFEEELLEQDIYPKETDEEEKEEENKDGNDAV